MADYLGQDWGTFTGASSEQQKAMMDQYQGRIESTPGGFGTYNYAPGFDGNFGLGMAFPAGSPTGAATDTAGGGGFFANLMQKSKDGDFGSLQGWGQLAGGVGDIGSAYMAYKNYGLAKEQFAFGKDLTNRNLSNQSIVANQKMDAWSKARGMSSVHTDGSPIG